MRLICNCQITDLMCAFGGPKGLVYRAGVYIFEMSNPRSPPGSPPAPFHVDPAPYPGFGEKSYSKKIWLSMKFHNGTLPLTLS